MSDETIVKVADLIRRVDAVAGVLKKRFPNLTAEEVIEIAGKILMALEGK